MQAYVNVCLFSFASLFSSFFVYSHASFLYLHFFFIHAWFAPHRSWLCLWPWGCIMLSQPVFLGKTQLAELLLENGMIMVGKTVHLWTCMYAHVNVPLIGTLHHWQLGLPNVFWVLWNLQRWLYSAWLPVVWLSRRCQQRRSFVSREIRVADK